MFFEETISFIHGFEKYFYGSRSLESLSPGTLLCWKRVMHSILFSFLSQPKSFLICCGLMSGTCTSCGYISFLHFMGSMYFIILQFLHIFLISFITQKANLQTNKLIFCKEKKLLLANKEICVELLSWVIQNLSSGVHAFNVVLLI